MELNIWYYGVYKFTNYIIQDTLLDNLVLEYMKKDPYLGMNTIVDFEQDEDHFYFCNRTTGP
mgnify:CR=1 FL=1